MDTTCIALDLELQDTADRGREILEIGAVRFRGQAELETFTRFVQTSVPVSHRITRLTGLEQSDLADAVPIAEALADLARFIGSTPVVGQSIELDAEQLKRAGLALRVPLLDTYELATLLLSGLTSYDLASVARTLEVELEPERHRALADARLAMRVFNRLVERVRDLDFDTLSLIGRLAEPLAWPLGLVFSEALRQAALVRATRLDQLAPAGGPAWLTEPSEPTRARETLAANERRARLDPELLEATLQAAGAVSSGPAGFEHRPEQHAMLRAVAEAFDESETLLAEAGTGTGKSLAYLVPAARFALANGRRVVVSTNTINLQDQLAHKELPSLRRALGDELRFTLLKGRSNYVCLRRWATLLRSEGLAPEERTLLIKTLLWLPATTTGDRAELRLVGREEEAWSKICALAESCNPQHCAYNRAGRCFLARARRAAEASHLIVVNHSLLLADQATRSRVLPDYRHLIVDEAHHLEDEATAQLGWRLAPRELTANLDRLWEVGPARLTGLVPRAVALLLRQVNPLEQARLERLQAELGFAIGDLADELGLAFEALKQFAIRHGDRSESGALTSRLAPSRRAQPAWSEIEVAWEQCNLRLLRLLRGLGDLLAALETAPEDEEWEQLAGELAAQAAFWDLVRERLWHALLETDPALVVWLSVGRGEEASVNAAPLHVGETLQQTLFKDKECVILTSATLTAEGSFRYVRERLGLDDARELLLGSPFDFAQAALIYLPTDIPEPNAAGYQASVERLTGQLIAGLEGRTLVLFTSHSQLRTTYQALKEPLEARQILLLGQRMDGASRSRLLESFKTGERVALMGTSSFWEGVDVVGEALSCLVIARLPFTAPSDPVFQARSEAFEEPFTQYAVPQAILRFRQGFGRLIRSRSDRGAVVVLDRRIRSRSYGRAFLRSLPDCTVQEGPGSRGATAVREWLERPLASVAAPVNQRAERDGRLGDLEGSL